MQSSPGARRWGASRSPGVIHRPSRRRCHLPCAAARCEVASTMTLAGSSPSAGRGSHLRVLIRGRGIAERPESSSRACHLARGDRAPCTASRHERGQRLATSGDERPVMMAASMVHAIIRPVASTSSSAMGGRAGHALNACHTWHGAMGLHLRLTPGGRARRLATVPSRPEIVRRLGQCSWAPQPISSWSCRSLASRLVGLSSVGLAPLVL